MNSSRMFPGRGDERDAASAERALHDRRAPDHVVALELAVEIVGEQRGMQEALGRQLDAVLVDGVREEGDHDRAEEHVGPFAVVPTHAVAHLAAGGRIEAACRVEVGHLHCDVRHTGDGHAALLVPGSLR